MKELIKQARPLGWTTIEESEKLIEAGLDPDTADIMGEIPCWSLGALLEMFPTANESQTDKCVNIQRRMKSKYYPAAWHLYILGPDDKALHFVDASTLIEGSVEMMLLCLEHGLVKKMEVNK